MIRRLLLSAIALVAGASLSGCAPVASDSGPEGSGQGDSGLGDSGGPPRRIVSINPCIDAVLMEVADPAQIAGISTYSHDPRATSIPIAQARRFAAVEAQADAVLAARPDLVLAGPHVAVQTVDALKRLGIPIAQYPVPQSVAENKAQISAIARRIGRAEAGAALNARIDAALAAARWDGAPATALIWQGSGLVPGGGTLADDLLSRTGFTNVSSQMGLAQWDILPLESLIARPPQVLLAGRADMGAAEEEGNRMLAHPALSGLRRHVRIADYPSSLLHCGGPVIIRSVARLAAVRRSLDAER